MKNIYLLMISSILGVNYCNAQIQVWTTGNVSIGQPSINPNCLLSVGSPTITYNYSAINLLSPAPDATSNTYGILSNASGSYNGYWSFGLVGVSTPLTGTSVGNSCGVSGEAYASSPLNYGSTIGVRGLAGNCTNGYNIGVLGMLTGTNFGAGVYGSINTFQNSLNSSYAGYFDGPVLITGAAYCNSGFWFGSDESIKRNIKQIDTNYKSIIKLNAVSFQYKIPTYQSNDTSKTERRYNGDTSVFNKTLYGYIAQDVEKIYPNLVYTFNNGIKCVNYESFIPLIIETLKNYRKELDTRNQTIDSLKMALVQLNQNIASCCKSNLLKSTGSSNQSSINEQNAILYQNNPNPFNQSTQINYYIPESTKSADLNIYDLTGIQLKSFQINTFGNGSVSINGSDLKPGMFLYTLIVDGAEVDTKRMILTN